MMARHFEFLGVPGSGKTTAYKLVLQALRRRGVHADLVEDSAVLALAATRRASWEDFLFGIGVKRPARKELKRPPESTHSPKYQAFTEFCRQHPEFSRFVFDSEESRIAPTRERDLPLFGWMLEQAWSHQLAIGRADGSDVLVRDHGFCQLGVSLFLYREAGTDLEALAKRYFSLVPAANGVMVVRASPDMIRFRLSERGYPSRMQPLSERERETILAKAAKSVEIGVAELRRRNVPVHEIDNEGSQSALTRAVEEAADRIASASAD